MHEIQPYKILIEKIWSTMALEFHEFLEPVEILYWFKYNGQKTIISDKNTTLDGSKRFCGECILTVDRRWVSF